MIYFICFDESLTVGQEKCIPLSDFEKSVSDGVFSGLATSSEPVKSVDRYVRQLDSQQENLSRRSDVSRYHLFQLRSMIYRVSTASICVLNAYDGDVISFSVCSPLSVTLPALILENYYSWHNDFVELDRQMKEEFSDLVKSKEVK